MRELPDRFANRALTFVYDALFYFTGKRLLADGGTLALGAGIVFAALAQPVRIYRLFWEPSGELSAPEAPRAPGLPSSARDGTWR